MSASGSLSAPSLWNGPLSESTMGPEISDESCGVTVSVMSTTPLSTLCEPVNVSLSSVAALAESELLLAFDGSEPEPEPPQAPTANATSPVHARETGHFNLRAPT